MGWWKINSTEDHIGDGPLDALGEAVSIVIADYQAEFGRKPTKPEWEALLRAVLGNKMPQYRCLDEGVVTRVVLDVEQ